MVGVTTVTGGTLQINNSLALEGQTLDVNVSDNERVEHRQHCACPGRADGNAGAWPCPAIPLTIGGNGASDQLLREPERGPLR